MNYTLTTTENGASVVKTDEDMPIAIRSPSGVWRFVAADVTVGRSWFEVEPTPKQMR